MSLTLAGNDYEETTATLTFGPSFPTRQCANVTILQNAILEGEESFSVQLTAVGSDTVILAPATATVFITDQDRKLIDILWVEAMSDFTTGILSLLQLS